MNLRRLRSRFSIANRRVAIRTHVPWYWRALLTVVLLAMFVGGAGAIFDLGRSLAGFQSWESEQKIAELEAQLADVRSEAQRLGTQIAGSETSLQIEQTAKSELSAQVKQLESENGRLREELATMESLVAGNGRAVGGPSISRASMQQKAAGHYQINAVLLSGAENGSDLDALVQILVGVLRHGKTDMLIFPSAGGHDADRFHIRLHKLTRFEGDFEIPADGKVSSIELRLVVKGASVATRKIPL